MNFCVLHYVNFVFMSSLFSRKLTVTPIIEKYSTQIYKLYLNTMGHKIFHESLFITAIIAIKDLS